MKKLFRVGLRILFSLPVIIIQAGLYYLFYRWYSEQKFLLSIVFNVLEVLLILHIVNKRGTSNYRMIWLVVILLIPVVGVYLYLITGNNSTASRLDRQIKKHAIYPAPKSLELTGDDYETRMLNLVKDVSHMPVTTGGKMKFYPIGNDELLMDMLDDLNSAEHFIFLEYFIIEKGVFWDSIIKILKRKVQDGVTVKIMYDDIGSIATYSPSSREILKSSGIDIISFNSIKFSPFMVNNRDHRKMMIIDNKIVYSGGINLADEYLNKKDRFGIWKDFAFKAEGNPVFSFTHGFCNVWNAFSKNKIVEPELFKPQTVLSNPDSKVITYFDYPSAKEHVSHTYFINALSNATDFAYFYTPYLILSDELKNALIYAAMRHVDVKIIIPDIPDKKIIYALTMKYAEELSSYGVKIYKYKGAFVHAKAAVIDDKLCSIGTVNLDYRSLFLHYENNTVTTDKYMISSIKNDFESTLYKSYKVEPKKHNPISTLIINAINFFSPLF